MKRHICSAAVIALLTSSMAFTGRAVADEYLSGIKWSKPPVIDPGAPDEAPSDALVLFDGKDLSKWNGADKWTVKDGVLIAGPGRITTKPVFGDCQIHLEWASDEKAQGSGQGRSNSGVFLMNKYEIQILDSYKN